MRTLIRPGIIIMLSATAPVQAADKEMKRPEVFDKLIGCRGLSDSVARLACYDAQVARLDEAAAKNEVVVVDRAEVRKARRGLFGLTLPDLGALFRGGGDEEPEEITQIESTIRQASQNQTGRYIFVLADGARWVQSDTTSIRIPKPGMTIKIRKAALGSYIANIAERPGIKVMRLN